MTPNESHLVDAMVSALSRGAPDVAQGLNKLANDQDSLLGYCDGAPVVAALCGEQIYIASGASVIGLNAESFQALQRFVERVGWQCD